jgi:hypothetical protein
MGVQSVHTASLSVTLQQCTHSHPHTCTLVGQVATCCHEVAAWQTQTWHTRRQTLHKPHLQQPRRVVNTLAAAGTQPAQLASAFYQQANPDRAQHRQLEGGLHVVPMPCHAPPPTALRVGSAAWKPIARQSQALQSGGSHATAFTPTPAVGLLLRQGQSTWRDTCLGCC